MGAARNQRLGCDRPLACPASNNLLGRHRLGQHAPALPRRCESGDRPPGAGRDRSSGYCPWYRGSAAYVATPARVYLTDRDTGFPLGYDIDLHVADGSQSASHHQSVLGRDILDQHLMVYDRRSDRIELHTR